MSPCFLLLAASSYYSSQITPSTVAFVHIHGWMPISLHPSFFSCRNCVVCHADRTPCALPSEAVACAVLPGRARGGTGPATTPKVRTRFGVSPPVLYHARTAKADPRCTVSACYYHSVRCLQAAAPSPPTRAGAEPTDSNAPRAGACT